MTAKRILLIGAGHAHLNMIARAGALVARGHSVTVIAPGPFWYSGMATGVVGGAYSAAMDQIDVARLAAKAGAAFLEDAMAGLDRATRTVRLGSGRTLPYDTLSLNIGSVVPDIPGADRSGCYAVKPIGQLAAMRADLEGRFRAGAATRVVIAGGGATAAELAANISALALKVGGEVELSIAAGGSGFLRQLPAGAAAAVTDMLRQRGLTILNDRALGITELGVRLASGDVLPFDVFLNATGLKPPPLLRNLGLPVDAEGAVVVDRHLRSVADPAIHAVGDCMALEGNTLPKIGVYAVRQGPVLLRNLQAAVERSAPTPFRPQRRYLWIMNLGDGAGLAMRGRFWWRGRSAFWLKDRIDRRFMRGYRDAATRRMTGIRTGRRSG